MEEKKYTYGEKTKLLNIINAIQIIANIILGAITIQNNIIEGFLYWGIGIVILGFLKGITDIIDILDEINHKLKK